MGFLNRVCQGFYNFVGVHRGFLLAGFCQRNFMAAFRVSGLKALFLGEKRAEKHRQEGRVERTATRRERDLKWSERFDRPDTGDKKKAYPLFPDSKEVEAKP